MAIDKTTGIDIIMDSDHYSVHDSQMYSLSYYATVTAASTNEFMINTGEAHQHVRFGAQVSGQTLIKLYENITSSVNGTSVTVFNMNRESSNSCAAIFFHTPTWSTNAEVVLSSDLLPGGAKNNTMLGSGSRKDSEWILKTDTKYLIQVTNQAASTIGASLSLQFYEL